MIEVRHLTKKYGKNTAVDDISFTVEAGKIYGFLGPNGAGKSTTMNMLTGCLSPTEGEIFINGFSMLDEPSEAKRHIGYLPEVPPLYLDMTPREYLRFVAEAKGVRRDKLDSEIENVMEATGVTEMSKRLIRNLSKGYRQRVGIAQAMLGDPDIVILDEPTEGLDPQQRAEIRELIGELGRERTVILSSHVLSEVGEVCDNIIVISHGRLVANDTVENISRSLTKDKMLSVTVKASRSEVEEVLSSVSEVDRYSIISDGAGEVTAKVWYSGDSDPRENISFAFSDIRRAVVSMTVIEENLEDIFLKLTGDEVNGLSAEHSGGDNSNEFSNLDTDENQSEEIDEDEDEDVVYNPQDYLGDADVKAAEPVDTDTDSARNDAGKGDE